MTAKENKNPLNDQAAIIRNTFVKSPGKNKFKTSGNGTCNCCTVTFVDTSAVSQALTQIMSEHLSEERFGDFGSFRFGIGSYGTIGEEFIR